MESCQEILDNCRGWKKKISIFRSLKTLAAYVMDNVDRPGR